MEIKWSRFSAFVCACMSALMAWGYVEKGAAVYVPVSVLGALCAIMIAIWNPERDQ